MNRASNERSGDCGSERRVSAAELQGVMDLIRSGVEEDKVQAAMDIHRLTKTLSRNRCHLSTLLSLSWRCFAWRARRVAKPPSSILSLRTKATSCSGCTGGQVILPLAHTLGHEEVIKLKGIGHNQETLTSRDLYLLQVGLQFSLISSKHVYCKRINANHFIWSYTEGNITINGPVKATVSIANYYIKWKICEG
ncbi:hypothetical protein Cni_G29152 [Canna indica]|uniref:Uncharacterized protein n=1 Tax=Canna indica TaxID=4628 RepID=A0AAQ3L6P9_9LILI|nr:hypothetical protein Cni_G29152 [Canna indica]